MIRARENDEAVVLDAVHRLELGLLPTSARGEPMGIVERGVWRQAGLQPMPWSGWS